MARTWNGISLPRGVEVRDYGGRTPQVGIRFTYRGVVCRELGLPAGDKPQAKRSIGIAEKKLQTIQLEQQMGTFKYGNHFPQSPRCATFGEVNTTGVTIGALLDEWFAAAKDRLEAVSYHYYERHAKTYLARWRDVTVPQFTNDAIEDWLNELAATGMVLKSARNIIIPLNNALDRAVRYHKRTGLNHNPLDAFKLSDFWPKEQRKSDYEVQPFNEAERAALLKALERKHPEGWRLYSEHQARLWKNLLVTWWYGGYRPEEVIALKWTDVDWEAERISVSRVNSRGKLRERTKTQAGTRMVPMIGPVKAALKDQRELTGLKAHGLIFESPWSGKPFTWTQSLSNYQWPTLLKRAGVKHRGPNQNRHTFASIMFAQHEDEQTVAKIMGHTDSRTTRRHYARMITDPGSKHGFRLHGEYEKMVA